MFYKKTGIKYLILLFIPLLFVCKKKKKTEKRPTEISIGSLSLITLFDVNPDATILSSQVKSNYAIDLNSDGTNDINIIVWNKWACASAIHSESIAIETLNSSSYVLCDSNYPSTQYDGSNAVISQTVINNPYPKVLSYNNSIAISDNWKQGVYQLSLAGASICPPDGSHYTEGYWINQDQKYIGVRFEDRLGWIKVGDNQYSLKIYEYAIAK